MEPREYEVMLHDAEIRLARVKALYEQYFQGIEKLEPTVPRKELDRLFEVLRKNQPRNTALRFRTQMLFAKYGTYQTYWQRTARQIEEGTYRRDLVRVAQRRQKNVADRERSRAERGADNEGPSAWELDVDVELEEPESAQVAFDDSDVDAILGSLGPKLEPTAAPRRSLSPFSMGSPPPGPRTTPLPAAGQTGEHAIAKPATTTFAKPVTTTFGKPGAPATTTFGRPGGVSGGAATFAKPGTSAAKPSSDGGPIPQPSTAATPVRPPAPSPPPSPPHASAQRPPVPSRPLAPPRAPPETAEESRMRKLYDSYVEAKKKNNERVDNVKFETLAQSVQQMMPKLREKHGNRPIDFEIVVQNGKVGLKPKVGG